MTIDQASITWILVINEVIFEMTADLFLAEAQSVTECETEG